MSKFNQGGTRLIKWKLQNIVEIVEEDLNEGKDLLCSWIRFNIVKMAIPPNLFYRFIVIPIKITVSSFAATNKL